jgi:hypothetical protein
MKMAVLVHVRAKTSRAAIQRDLPSEPGFYQSVEAVVNRRVRNLRHLSFGADENFLGGRVVALLEQHVINLLALRREAEAARAQPFDQVAFRWFAAGGAHAKKNLAGQPALSRFRTILNLEPLFAPLRRGAPIISRRFRHD